MQPELAVVSLPVAALVPYAENARTHSPAQVAQIASSIAEFGFVNPVLVDGAGVLVAGHGRVMAAKKLGMASVPAIRLAHGLVAYLCRSDYSCRPPGVRRPGGFCLPTLNAFGAGYRSR